MDCRFDPSNIGATCSGHVDLPKGDESALQEAVATIGPISVSIDAHLDSFRFYESGKICLMPVCIKGEE